MIYRIFVRKPALENPALLKSFVVSILFVLAASALLPAACYALPQNQAQPTAKPAQLNSETVSTYAIEQRLIEKERMSWGLAIKQNATSYRALHAPDFFTVSGSGVTDRAHSEASALDSNVHFDQCKLSGFGVRFVAGNAALITYRAQAAGLDHGKAFHLDSYASSLWIERDGKWLNVFYQSTPAAAQ